MAAYKLTPLEQEQLKKWGYGQEVIDQAKITVSSYEDWLADMPIRSLNSLIWEFGLSKSLMLPVRQGDPFTDDWVEGTTLKLYILHESEWLKIQERKGEILEGFVTAYTAALIACFESRYEGWRKGEALIREEIALLDKLLFQGQEPVKYAPHCVGSWLRFENDGQQRGTLYESYTMIYERKMDPSISAINNTHAAIPAHELRDKDKTLHFLVAAKAFDRFYEYLNTKLAEGEAVPLTEKILTEKDCFIYKVGLTGMPPSERDLAEKKARDERIAAEQKAGKIPVLANCHHCEVIIRGALKIGLTASELNVFIEKFGGHTYNNYAAGPHFDKENDRLNTDTLLDEVFSMADSFDNPILGTYFAQSAYDEVQRKAIDHWPSQSLMLKKQFRERLAECNAPTLNAKAGRKPNPPRTFQSLFKGEPEMKRLLAAAESVELIVMDGDNYLWLDEGDKGHRIRAFWYAAVDAGLIKKNLKNKDATATAIKNFFGMVSLSKDTLDNENPNHENYKSIKSALEKKLKI